MINNDSDYEDILQDNCTQCNNSLCWSDDSYQEYLYYTQVQCAVSYVIFKYFLILQVSNYEVLVILINGILMLSGVFGNKSGMRLGKQGSDWLMYLILISDWLMCLILISDWLTR